MQVFRAKDNLTCSPRHQCKGDQSEVTLRALLGSQQSPRIHSVVSGHWWSPGRMADIVAGMWMASRKQKSIANGGEELAGCDWPLLTLGGRPTSSEALRSQWPASSNRQRILRYCTFHPPHRLSLDAHLQEKRLGPGRIMACKLDAFPSRNAPRLLHAVTRGPTSAEHSPTTPRTLCSTAAILGSLPPRVPCSVGFAIFVDD
jgi:hypothetical protein